MISIQKRNMLFRKDWPNKPEVVEGKACSLINIAAGLGQTVSSIIAGPLLDFTGDVNSLMLISCVAAVLVSLVTLITPMGASEHQKD